MNGDLLDKSHDDAIRKKQKNASGELDKQLNQTVARQRPHKEMLLQIDTEILKQKSKFSKTQTYEGHNEPNRQQRDTNSKVHVCCPYTRGTPTEDWRTQHVDSRFEQNLNSQKVRLKAYDITWEKTDNSLSQVGTKTVSGTSCSSAGNGVNPTETKGVKNKKDAAAERSKEGKSIKQRTDADVSVSVGNSSLKTFHVFSNGHSPPSPSRRRRTNEPTEYNFPSSACKKANNLKRNNKTQHPVTAHNSKLEVAKGEKNANLTNNVKREPWR